MPLAFWRLIRVGLVVLGPVFAIYLLMQWAILPELRSRGERLLESNADTIREGTDRFCQHWFAQAESNAADPGIQTLFAAEAGPEQRAGAEKELSILRESLLGLRRIGVWDLNAKVILEQSEASSFTADLVASAVRETIASIEPRILVRPSSSSTMDPSFFFLVPIKRAAKAIGAMGLEVDGGELRDLLKNRLDQAGPGSFGTLYDEKGHFIASSFLSAPSWLGADSLDPAIATRLASMPALDLKTREKMPERAGEIRQAFGRSQSAQIFSTKNPIDGERHRVVVERLQRAPWTVAYQTPLSTFTGMFDQAGLLILLIGLVAAAIAFFSFQPDRRVFDSFRSFRPEIGALAVGLLLVGVTFALRYRVFQLAEEDARDYSAALASSCARQIEDAFRLRSGLLHDFSWDLTRTSSPETVFRERAEFLRRDFGGTLLVRWDSPPKEGPRGVWIEGDRQLEDAKPLPAAREGELSSSATTRVGLFAYPGSGEGVLVASRLAGEGREGWLYWAESLPEILRRSLSVVPVEGYQVTVRSGDKSFPLFPEFRAAADVPVQKSRVSLPGGDWEVEVATGESVMGHRYQLLGLVVTILGLVLAAGGAATAYFLSANADSLREVSSKDELTGIRNRRAFNEMMEREVSIADRYRRALSLMLLDLDHFKQINDTMGHAIGDEVLRVAAETINRAVRETDVPFRFGGEEFAVLMAETDLVAAAGIAERIRGAVESTPISTEKGPVRLTISIGVTGFQSGESIDQFLTRADMALYRAKAEGRNRVVVDRPSGWEA